MIVTLASHEIPGTEFVVSIHRNTLLGAHVVELSESGYPVQSREITREDRARELANKWWQDNHPDRPKSVTHELGHAVGLAHTEPSGPVMSKPQQSSMIQRKDDGSVDRHSVYAPGPRVTETGYYQHGGGVYKVVRSGRGNLYVNRLDPKAESKADRWIYAGIEPMAYLRPADKMTREQAANFGRETGICVTCGAVLTHPVSIERGMGPICYGKWYDES